MNCPYCAEEIKDEAIACKHCGRDLYLFLPLLKQVGTLNRRVEELEAVIDGLQAYGYQPRGEEAAAAAAESASQSGTTAAPRRTPIRPLSRQSGPLPSLAPLLAISLAILGLVVAHFLIVIVYDASLWYLFTASLVIPLACGYFMRVSEHRSLAVDFVTSVGIAVISILIMSFAVARTDHVPVLPQGGAEWSEFVKYVCNIAFGFFAGVLARSWHESLRRPAQPGGRIAVDISRLIIRHRRWKEEEFEKNLKRVETSVASVMAIGAAVLSVATGLSHFMNSL